MKRAFMIGVLAAAAVGATAMAQGVRVVVEPEQRTVIREYVKRERVPTARVEERLRVGVRLPAAVELRAVPPAWGSRLSRYRYVYIDDRVVLVDPDEGEVVHIIE